MIKSEQFRGTDQFKRLVPSAPTVSPSSRTSMFHTTSNVISQQVIDPHAIDISSIKGRFAWEKISPGDTYMPVIFRGTIKYFCVKMLHKLLYEYPDDVIRRSSYYQYRKPIELYGTTPNEIKLLNRINAHHSHWAYSRQPFTGIDELVRVSDFLPFYEYLRSVLKPTPIPRTASIGSLRPIATQSQKPMQRSPDFVVNMSNVVRGRTTLPLTTTSIQIQPCTTSESPRQNIPSAPRPIAPVPSALQPPRPPKDSRQPMAPQYPSAQLQQQLPLPPSHQPIATTSNSTINSTNKVLPNKLSTVPVPSSTSQSSIPTTSILTISSSSPDSVASSSTTTSSRKLSINSSDMQLTPISNQSTPSPSVSKQSHLHSGWLQINKLYTPYISTSTSNHHLYKIPVSLLTFYDLLKISSCDNNSNESKDISFSFEQTLVTPQEIELINDLCLKQNIKPFSIDTKLIDLSTFYKHCSANILFVKELPLNEPKASICKDWSTIVQINGGICHLRNITTLHEQTVPFIGKNLLKNFIISSQCLASASLSTPTTSEMEFLQLILFFSNMSINIRHAKLIDIESVQKEYNVDLILLFNDKFPLNVLNYQNQDNRTSTSQGQLIQSDSSAATNTFAESTPPPSPPSPATNNLPIHPTSQLPLTTSASSNRYQKTITFHGHSMTAYICSGLGSNSQRECISIGALCNMLYPNSSIINKLETKMLRLLRIKNINRFRPQNQQSMGFTRLIDIKDVEKHWDHIEQGMRSLSNNDGERNVIRGGASSLLSEDLKASTLDKVESDSKKIAQETSIEVNKSEKRPLERELQDEDVPVLERFDKRVRCSEEDVHEKSDVIRFQSTKTIKKTYDNSDGYSDETEKEDDKVENRRTSTSWIKIVRRQPDKKHTNTQIPEPTRQVSSKPSISSRKPVVPVKKKIRLIRKRRTPRVRSSKQSTSTWVQKYNIEECCIRLDLYDPIYETAMD